MKRHHHFIFHLSVIVTGSLIGIALGLLYYYDLERHFISQAAQVITPRQHLYEQAHKKGLDAELLNRIVSCESHWKMVKNPKSSAYGYFQILDRTEQGTPYYLQGKSKTDPFVNIDMGIYLFEHYGWLPWTESKPCWGWKI